MKKLIVAIIVIVFISFYAGTLYQKRTDEITNVAEKRKSYFSDIVSSMTMLEFNREDTTLAEKIHLAKVKRFFKDKPSIFSIFIPQNSYEEKAYKTLKEKAIKFQEKYCKDNCLINRKT